MTRALVMALALVAAGCELTFDVSDLRFGEPPGTAGMGGSGGSAGEGGIGGMGGMGGMGGDGGSGGSGGCVPALANFDELFTAADDFRTRWCLEKGERFFQQQDLVEIAPAVGENWSEGSAPFMWLDVPEGGRFGLLVQLQLNDGDGYWNDFNGASITLRAKAPTTYLASFVYTPLGGLGPAMSIFEFDGLPPDPVQVNGGQTVTPGDLPPGPVTIGICADGPMIEMHYYSTTGHQTTGLQIPNQFTGDAILELGIAAGRYHEDTIIVEVARASVRTDFEPGQCPSVLGSAPQNP